MSAPLKRYTCQVNYVLQAGGQAQGFGLNCMSTDSPTAIQDALAQVKGVFPSAVAMWVDNIQVISDVVA